MELLQQILPRYSFAELRLYLELGYRCLPHDNAFQEPIPYFGTPNLECTQNTEELATFFWVNTIIPLAVHVQGESLSVPCYDSVKPGFIEGKSD